MRAIGKGRHVPNGNAGALFASIPGALEQAAVRYSYPLDRMLKLTWMGGDQGPPMVSVHTMLKSLARRCCSPGLESREYWCLLSLSLIRILS